MATNIATMVLMVANAFIWLHNLKNNFGVRLKNTCLHAPRGALESNHGQRSTGLAEENDHGCCCYCPPRRIR